MFEKVSGSNFLLKIQKLWYVTIRLRGVMEHTLEDCPARVSNREVWPISASNYCCHAGRWGGLGRNGLYLRSCIKLCSRKRPLNGIWTGPIPSEEDISSDRNHWQDRGLPKDVDLRWQIDHCGWNSGLITWMYDRTNTPGLSRKIFSPGTGSVRACRRFGEDLKLHGPDPPRGGRQRLVVGVF